VAADGMINANHFYLGSHGRLTEVSRAIFLYSTYHGRVSYAGLTIALASLLVLKWTATDGRRLRDGDNVR
jgi:hypothetical protein